jgi:hypothetical protein
MRFVFLFLFAAAFAVDPKVGDKREKVIALLGQPNSKLPLKDGAEVFSYPRGDVFFDKYVVTRLTLLPEAEFKRQEEERTRPVVLSPAEVAAKNKAIVDRILVNFEAMPANPGEPIIYRHKVFAGQKYGLVIRVYVASDGYMALATNYYGGRWIFHDSASVGIGDRVRFTGVLAAGEPSRRVEGNGFINESCLFGLNGDQEIVREMAKAKGAKIMVSVTRGRASVLDSLTEQQFASFPPIVELKPDEVKAVQQSVELADAFQRLKADK